MFVVSAFMVIGFGKYDAGRTTNNQVNTPDCEWKCDLLEGGTFFLKWQGRRIVLTNAKGNAARRALI
jgi:hypothetical protein